MPAYPFVHFVNTEGTPERERAIRRILTKFQDPPDTIAIIALHPDGRKVHAATIRVEGAQP